MYKVMIVDDEPLMLDGMRLMVNWEAYGFTLSAQASSAAEALQLLQKTHVDLLFTDIAMPDTNGVELSEYCRERYPGMLIAYFSGYQDFSYAQSAMRVNAIGYLLKPIDPDAVHALLEAASGELSRRLQRMKPAMQRVHVLRRMAGGEDSFLTCTMIQQLLEIRTDTLCACALLQRTDGQIFEESLRVDYPRTEQEIPIWLWPECLALVLLDSDANLNNLRNLWEQRLGGSLILSCGSFASGGRGLCQSLREAQLLLREALPGSQILRRDETGAESEMPAVVLSLMQSIRAEYAEPLNLQSLAVRYDLNPAYLGQLFRQYSGRSFSQSLLERRMQVAGALLRETELSVKSVALEVGIRDASSFSVQFRKYYGLSPLDYRKESTDDTLV